MVTTRQTTAEYGPESTSTDAVFEQSQNATFLLLQPPMLQHAGLRPLKAAPTADLLRSPTTRDIPPVALTAIQTVDDTAFKVYNQSMGAIFDRLHRLKDTEGPPSASPHGGPLALSIVPRVYLDQDFHLQNPRTFDVVSEKSYIAGKVSSPDDEMRAGTGTGTETGTETVPTSIKPLATNAILQEKLSWYLDTVEMCLVDAISMSATAFFSALLSLRNLCTDVEDSLQKVKLLRKSFALLETDTVGGHLEILRKWRILYNMRVLSDAVMQMKHIVDSVGHIEALVEQGHVEEALDKTDAAERLISGGERGDVPTSVQLRELRDLHGIAALQGARSDLYVLRSRIGKAFEQNLLETLIGDLQHHVQSVSTENVIMQWEAAFQRSKGSFPRELSVSDAPAYMRMTSELREALLPGIRGLYRSNAILSAVRSYRELALREIRNVIRKPLPSSGDDGAESSMLAHNIQALDTADAERLFSLIFVGVTQTLRRLQTQSSVHLDAAHMVQLARDDIDSTKLDEVRSERQKQMHNALDLSSLVSEAVDISHEKINDILRLRSKQSTSLPLDHFLRYFTLNLLFVNECEAISGRAKASLKAIVDSHIKEFIAAYKDQEIQALTQAMDADTWQVQGATDQDQAILRLILMCGTSDPPQWAQPIKEAMRSAEEESSTSDTGDASAQGAIVVEEETFLIPRSALVCLVGVSHFLRLISSIPSMATDISLNISLALVAYLQVFNSQCRQLVLGAGALRSAAGLRNINTLHLVLASRALAFVAALLPYIRELVRRHLPLPTGSPANARAVTSDFDKVRWALQEHQGAIHQKLADMMAARALVLSTKARETDWADWAEEGKKDGGPRSCEPRDTSKLYKVLVKYLPAHEVGLVMVPVFTSYKDLLSEAFKAAEPRTESGKACMSRDVKYMISKLGKMQVFANLGMSLIGIIENKENKDM